MQDSGADQRAVFLQKFRQSRGVDAAFSGLRPASMGLIAAAFLQVCSIALLAPGALSAPLGLSTFNLPAIALAAVVFVCMRYTPMKKLHPIVFIALSAAVGILFKL